MHNHAGSTDREDFFRHLQQMTTRVHATRNIDEIMLDLSADICQLFEADRLTIYRLGDDKASLESKVKTGLASFKQLKLPITAQSVAGYVALSRKLLNLRDVYDEAELTRHAAELSFQQGVDKRTGYRTRQMLVAPVMGDGEVLGVVQLINNLSGGAFPELAEEGLQHFCETLGIAFSRRSPAPRVERTGFVDALHESVLPRAQLEQALASAAASGTDIEEVLLNECGLKAATLGRALADYYNVPYVAFHPERRRPAELLKNFNREFVIDNQWMPIDENKTGVYILSTDPERVKHSGEVARLFAARPVYCVTTRREFAWMVNQCFTSAPEPELDTSVAHFRDSTLLAPVHEAELLKAVGAMALLAQGQGLSDVRIETSPGKDKTEVKFTVSGTITLP
ncbi:MAG: GAF domain-containing protein [Pseudomonadota bacterium]